MIPEEKQAVVRRALSETFGVEEFEDIRLLTGGLSTALVFRIVVRGQPYLLRLIMNQAAVYDPTRQFACMKLAYEAGIAPRLRYANVEDRLMITDFVVAKPFPGDMVLQTASTIRTLHALPRFAKGPDYLAVMDGLIRRFQDAKLLPASATDELFSGYAEVVRVYPCNEADLVSSHNDLKPQNMIFDGDRLWLVDWEAAFLNDPYVDLAVVANFFVQDEGEEEAYLRTYFSEPASEYRRARFYLMRQAMHVFYIAFLMPHVAAAGVLIDENMTAPDFRDFHERLISGEVPLLTAEERLEYAKVHLNEVLKNMRTQRFKDSLDIVEAAHKQ